MYTVIPIHARLPDVYSYFYTCVFTRCIQLFLYMRVYPMYTVISIHACVFTRCIQLFLYMRVYPMYTVISIHACVFTRCIQLFLYMCVLLYVVIVPVYREPLSYHTSI